MLAVLFAVRCRRVVARAARAREDRLAAQPPTTVRVVVAPTRAATAPVRAPAEPATATDGLSTDPAPTVQLRIPQAPAVTEPLRIPDAPAVTEPLRTSAAARGAEWQPVPVPLPTYVGKAVAPRRAPRPVQPQPWSAELPDDAPVRPEREDAAERRRAVGGW